MDDKHVIMDLLTELVKNKMAIFGEGAVRKVQQLPHLVVDNSGTVVSISGDLEQAVKDVFLVYEKISGRTSTISGRILLKKLITYKFPQHNHLKRLIHDASEF